MAAVLVTYIARHSPHPQGGNQVPGTMGMTSLDVCQVLQKSEQGIPSSAWRKQDLPEEVMPEVTLEVN